MKQPDSLVEELSQYFPSERLKTRLIDLHAYSSDASCYLLVPRAVVFPLAIHEIQLLFQIAKRQGTSVTFRTGGTSLSGQAVTDGILVDLSRNWPLVRVEGGGAFVRVQPGVIGSVVNHSLRGYARKIGPDPASIGAAMMGGILSNNSSGMCCGVSDNSYHTLAHLKFVLADGTVFHTEDAADYRRFEGECPFLFEGIRRLQQRVRGDEELLLAIRRKYRIKNTVGYGLNAFVDFDHPLDVLAHLMIGAEGTLGFIAEAVLHTIPDKPYKSAALLFFDSPRSACDAIAVLKSSGAEALEFMDRAALRSIEELSIAPFFLKALPSGAACILCEYQASGLLPLQAKLVVAGRAIDSLPLIYRTDFTSEEQQRTKYWKLRKGMYPSVAAVREKGTSVMLEDIAVPVERLGEAIEDLQELLDKFHYHQAIIFGHAKDGNLHFVVSQPIATPGDIAVFAAFNDALAEMVIGRFRGSLKAEHGTGRQVAPYVEAEWGTSAYRIMKELKQLVDPATILNPGVLLNEDKNCHLRHLKSLPVVEEEVDKCVECGYCEQSCPSRNYTLTPRQRIVLRRSLSRLKAAGEHAVHDAIVKDYQYEGMDTCAVDGMCATNCPVGINTGELVKRLRRESHSHRSNVVALRLARNFGKMEGLIKGALRSGNLLNALLGKGAMGGLTAAIRRVFPSFPLWTPQLTGPLTIRPVSPVRPQAVYFVGCINRMMGRDRERADSIVDVCLRLAARAKVELLVPDLSGVCCGQVFSSKGFTDAYRFTVNRTVGQLWEWTGQGAIPVVMDISSCTHSLHTCRPYLDADNRDQYDRLTIMDSLEFALDILYPRLTISKKMGKAVFHPVCSLYKMGLANKLEKLAVLTVEEPVIPFTAGCCGMAGDRGFYYPGLTALACREEGAEAAQQGGDGYYSTGKTCEMAISEAAGKNYRSIFYLLEEVSR